MRAKDRKENKIIFLSCILIIVLGFFVYFNSLSGKFIWDDQVLVENNTYIKSWHNLGKIFTTDIGQGGGDKFYVYRPIQIFSYAVDYSIWKLNAKGYHLTNIILHILTALVIFLLIKLLFTDKLVASLTAILFVMHPVHTETVNYISNRADLLAAVFMLLSLTFYIKSLRSKKINTYILALTSFLFAVLSKEYCLILPFLFILFHYTFKIKLKIKPFLPILAIPCLYIFLRLTALSLILPPKALFTNTLLQRIPGFFVALTDYLKLLILPLNLHMEYGNKLFNILDSKAVLGGLIFAMLVFCLSVTRKNNKLIFFSISWFLLALFPQSNLFPVNAYMAEHWLYLPSIGFFLVLAYGLSCPYRNENLRSITAIFLVALLGLYSFLTIRQNDRWREPKAFYERTLKYTPNSHRVLNNLANEYKNIGKTTEAIALYKKAIEIQPNSENAFNNLGLLYHDTQHYSDAIEQYQKAIEINPDYAKAYNNFANAYKETGKPEEAITLYRKAIQLNPDYADAYNNLGIVLYTDLGRREEAITAFEKAIEIDPGLADVYNNLAAAYYYKKQYALAAQYCEKAVKLGYKVDPKFLKEIERIKK